MTWDYLPIGYWSAVEAHVGVMIACLPGIRSLQSSIQRKLFPKPATQPSYYENDTKGSNSKKASCKDSNPRILGSLGRSRTDEEDFVRLDEFEMKGESDSKSGGNSPVPSSFDRTLSHSFKSNEDDLPLANSGQPMGGIMVESEYSVDRSSPLGKTPTVSSDQELAYRLGGRI